MKINLIIKPTAECNLRCKYCYHATTHYVKGILSFERLEKLLRMCCEAYDQIKITWHGGEPMLAGIEYYQRAMNLERELEKVYNVTFENSMQTNGTLIDRKWASFFKKSGIVPGISFDGPCNDQVRQNSKQTLKGLGILRKKGFSCGILTVVTQLNLNLIELYEHNKKLSKSLQFNPIMRATDQCDEFTIDVAQYVEQVVALFDHWLYDSDDITVSPFVYYLYLVLGIPRSNCANGSCLGKWLDVDSSGVIRTCSHSMDSLFVLGTIDEISSVSKLFESENFGMLLKKAIERRAACKQSCQFFKYCQGGCISTAFMEGKLESRSDFSCVTFCLVFGHIQKTILELLRNKTPLEKLNPAVQRIISDAMSLNAEEIYRMLEK